jgi:asparagine synthase (glutamine-hydrolysing)
MLVSMEVREPFLDDEVVEFARKLPHDYKYRKGQTKFLLKSALAGLLPHDLLSRRKKGFGIPLMDWMKGWSREPASDQDRLPVSLDKVERKWLEHRSGKRDHRLFLWAWVVLEQHLASLART